MPETSPEKIIKALHAEFAEALGVRVDEGLIQESLIKIMTRRLEDYIESRIKNLSFPEILELINQINATTLAKIESTNAGSH